MIEAILYSFAAAIVVVGAFFLRAEAKETAPAAPAAPQTPESALRSDVQELRRRLDQTHGLTSDEMAAIKRQLDRIERRVDAVCERMDTDARIGAALTRLSRGEA